MGAGRDAADERPGEAETLNCNLTQRKDETRQLRSCSGENVILNRVCHSGQRDFPGETEKHLLGLEMSLVRGWQIPLAASLNCKDHGLFQVTNFQILNKTLVL